MKFRQFQVIQYSDTAKPFCLTANTRVTTAVTMCIVGVGVNTEAVIDIIVVNVAVT